MEVIQSVQNPAIRRLVKLRRSRRRRAAGVVLADGAREIGKAYAAGLNLRAFYESAEASQASPADPHFEKAREYAIQNGVGRRVSKDVFAKICYGEATGRCVAEFDEPVDDIETFVTSGSGLILVLDQVEKPGNIGAVFRSADAAGVLAVILCDCPCDRFNPNAIRSSLGAVFTVPSVSGNQQQVQARLSKLNSDVVAMRVEGANSLYEQFLWKECKESGGLKSLAIVLGSEADGLQDRWREMSDTEVPGVFVPMAGQIDSLNVSVSAALVAFEAMKQRKSWLESESSR